MEKSLCTFCLLNFQYGQIRYCRMFSFLDLITMCLKPKSILILSDVGHVVVMCNKID